MQKISRILLLSSIFIILSNLFACQHDESTEPESQPSTESPTNNSWDTGKWDQAVWK